MEFPEERKLKIHRRTHESKRPKRQKNKMHDFDKPDFSQVNM